MDISHASMFGKATDYKLCKECNHPNFYDNEECVMCQNTSFKERGDGVIEWLNESYAFYEDDGYSENEIDYIYIDV